MDVDDLGLRFVFLVQGTLWQYDVISLEYLPGKQASIRYSWCTTHSSAFWILVSNFVPNNVQSETSIISETFIIYITTLNGIAW